MAKFNKNPRWMWNKYRFDTTDHNALVTELPKDVQVQVAVNYNESKQLEALSSMTTTTIEEAIRISLYEVQRIDAEMVSSLKQPREKRNTTVDVNLTGVEALLVIDTADRLGITADQVLLAIPLLIYSMIKDQKVRSLGGCRVLSQAAVRKQHDQTRSHKTAQHILDRQATYKQRGEEMDQAWEEHLEYWTPIIDSYIKTRRAPEFCWDGDEEFGVRNFNPETFIWWYNNVEMAEHNGEASFQRALDMDREEGIATLVEVYAQWGTLGESEEELLATATEAWETHNAELTEEEIEGLEADLEALQASANSHVSIEGDLINELDSVDLWSA